MQSELLFRFLYNSFFTLLAIILIALLLITPADAIHQALNNNQLYNVFVVAGCYLLTLILASLIYASRLYTNRTVLAAIPKTYIPVEKGDVGKRVRKMIAESLNRSALIAWESSPRIPSKRPADEETPEVTAQGQENLEVRTGKRKRKNSTGNTALSLNIPSHLPVWGEISHRGWSSPLSDDLPNLQYITVIQELPNLIEAKAVSLAPTDPTADPPMPDLRVIDLLQRPATLGLREYVSRLINLGTITDPILTNDFIVSYEYARFSTETLSEHEFRHLMKLLADLLRNMTPLDPAIFDDDNQDSLKESDIDDDASSKSTPRTPRSRSIKSRSSGLVSRSGSEGTIRTAPSRRIGTNSSQANHDSMSLHTKSAPVTPKGKMKEALSMTRMPSTGSFAQTRIPYARSQASSSSLRSSSTKSGGSVIRLNLNAGESDLPYVIGL